MGNCLGGGGSGVSADEKQSYEEFKKFDADKDKILSKDELATYIASHGELWAMLGANLNLDDSKCKEIATHVAYTLATTDKHNEDQKSSSSTNATEPRILNKEEFHRFRQKYVTDPRGSQEFFHRTVFAAFDLDSNGQLDKKEIDNFLDIFYKADSIFAGDKRLPKNKKKLRKIVMDKLDANNDGLLSFEEIRGLLSGNIDLMGLSEKQKSEKTRRTQIKAKRKSTELQKESSHSRQRSKQRIILENNGQPNQAGANNRNPRAANAPSNNSSSSASKKKTKPPRTKSSSSSSSSTKNKKRSLQKS